MDMHGVILGHAQCHNSKEKDPWHGKNWKLESTKINNNNNTFNQIRVDVKRVTMLMMWMAMAMMIMQNDKTKEM